MSGSTSSGPGPNCEIDKTAMLQIYMLGARMCVEVAMDWTDFDADNQATIMLSLITRHGRTTPLVWLSVELPDFLPHGFER